MMMMLMLKLKMGWMLTAKLMAVVMRLKQQQKSMRWRCSRRAARAHDGGSWKKRAAHCYCRADHQQLLLRLRSKMHVLFCVLLLQSTAELQALQALAQHQELQAARAADPPGQAAATLMWIAAQGNADWLRARWRHLMMRCEIRSARVLRGKSCEWIASTC